MIADHVGRESVVRALGRDWRVGRWTRGIWEEWLLWLKERTPDPMQLLLAKLDKFPDHLQAEAVRHAIDRSAEYMSPGSPVVNQALGSLEGNVRLFWLLLREHQPGITEDEALAVCVELGDRRREVLERSQGKLAEGNGQSQAV